MGHIKEGTHDFRSNPSLGNIVNYIYNGSDVTHLTVYRDCGIKADHVENYGQKGGQACKGVNL